MDKKTVDSTDFHGALCALREYKDLSYLTNGPGFLVGVVLAYLQNDPDDLDAMREARKVLDERGFKWPEKNVYNRWDDPFDGIFPVTFA
jgi:hypothetical protein